MFLFTSAFLLLPKDKQINFLSILKEIRENDFTLGPKAIAFPTHEAAVEFAERLSKLAGFDFYIDPISQTPDSFEKYHGKQKSPGESAEYTVSFMGVINPGKKEGDGVVSENEFLTQVQDVGRDISRKSELKTTTSGEELLVQSEDASLLLSKDFKAQKKNEKMLTAIQQAIVGFYLGLSKIHPSGSDAQSQQMTWAVLQQLAVSLGFKGDKAAYDFLKSDYGAMFHAELKEAVSTGKFFVIGGATSEQVNDLGELRSEFNDYAKVRAEKIVRDINVLFEQAGLEQLYPPLLPVVFLVYQPTEKIRQKLVNWGMEEFSSRCTDQRALEKARKYLDDYYSAESIQKNANIQFDYIRRQALEENDPEAISAWNKLTTGKYSCVSYTQDENGNYNYEVTNAGNFNSLFSLTRGRRYTPEQIMKVKDALNTPGGILDTSRYLGQAKFAAFSFDSQTSLAIEIMSDKTQFAPGEITIPLTVSQKFAKEDGTFRTGEFKGKVTGKVIDSDGKEAEDLKITRNEDGTWSAAFNGEAGKTYRMLFYAMNTDSEGKNIGDSGRVFWEAKVEEETYYKLEPHVSANVDDIVPGEESTISITAYGNVFSMKGDKKGGKVSTVPLDLLTILVGRAPGGKIKYLLGPGEDKDIYVKKVQVQEFASQEKTYKIAVEAPLCYRGKQVYDRKTLLTLAKQGAVAIMLKDTSGDEVWLTLDGKTEIKGKDLDDLKAKGRIDAGVLYLQPADLKLSKQEAQMTSNLPTALDTKLDGTTRLMMGAVERMAIQNVVLLPPGDVKIGGVEYSHDKILLLAEQNIIAVAEGDGIYGLDGHRVGDLKPIQELADSPIDDETRKKQPYHSLPEYSGVFAYLANFSQYSGIFAYMPRPSYFEKGDGEFTEKITYFVARKIKDVDPIIFSRQGEGKFKYDPKKYKSITKK